MDIDMSKRMAPANLITESLNRLRSEFYQAIVDVLQNARANSYRAVNFIMVEAYWNVGRMIVEEEQQGRSARDMVKLWFAGFLPGSRSISARDLAHPTFLRSGSFISHLKNSAQCAEYLPRRILPSQFGTHCVPN